MPALPYRDTPTKFGGIIRIWPGGNTEVIKRDFGLTTEPECSEEAHAKMFEWFMEHQPEIFTVPMEVIAMGQQPFPPPIPPP